MRAGGRSTAGRVGAVVLVLVLVAAVALVGMVVARSAAARQVASKASYPAITQPPATVAVPTAAFIGDSYSAGTGSSGYDSRFTTLVAAYEGWDSQSFAYGGTGYLRAATTSARTGCGADRCPAYGEVISSVKSYDPNIVLVSGGRNDVGLPQTDVADAITSFYQDLHTALPRARIIVTSPMWAYSSPPAQLAAIQADVRQAAASVGATYLDLGEPLVKNRSLVSNDRVHPNDAGHAELAREIEVALSRAG